MVNRRLEPESAIGESEKIPNVPNVNKSESEAPEIEVKIKCIQKVIFTKLSTGYRGLTIGLQMRVTFHFANLFKKMVAN